MIQRLQSFVLKLCWFPFISNTLPSHLLHTRLNFPLIFDLNSNHPNIMFLVRSNTLWNHLVIESFLYVCLSLETSQDQLLRFRVFSHGFTDRVTGPSLLSSGQVFVRDLMPGHVEVPMTDAERRAWLVFESWIGWDSEWIIDGINGFLMDYRMIIEYQWDYDLT